jgi:hypothetical protein
MVDVDTFLTTLSVMADDFCQPVLPPEPPPGPQAALSRSAVGTLARFGQWQRFPLCPCRLPITDVSGAYAPLGDHRFSS